MNHKNCGGKIKEDTTKLYEYETTDSEGREIQEFHPKQVCLKCSKEILGDEDIEDIKQV